METITIRDRQFKPYKSTEEVEKAIAQVAEQITADYADRTPIFICILTGAFMFLSDLMKKCNIPAEVAFWKVASYEGMSSTGVLKEVMPLSCDVRGRDVIVVEDIIDSGFTMQEILKALKEKGAKSTAVCAMLLKPDALRYPISVDYCAMRIPNDFIVGYGLDYDEEGRNLPAIYQVV